ncbi:MAG: hypothetical protein ACSLFE_03780 [Gemmatimonadaceae bacterium]
MTQPGVRFHLSSDNYIELVGLQNRITGAYPIDATVTVTVRDSQGVAVSGATDLSATHVAGTSGPATCYRAFVEDTVPLAIGQYEATVTAVKDGVKQTFHVPIRVERG